MKAIETKYKGYRFRSRLEARWAVFFDALGLQWEYEPEGYDLGEAGWYLPDFYLPECNMWVEIKGTKATEDEKSKCLALWNCYEQKEEFTDAFWLGDERIVGDLLGKISDFVKSQEKCFNATIINIAESVRSRKKVYLFEGLLDSGWMFVGKELQVQVYFPENVFRVAASATCADVLRARDAARSARFEHGEQG